MTVANEGDESTSTTALKIAAVLLLMLVLCGLIFYCRISHTDGLAHSRQKVVETEEMQPVAAARRSVQAEHPEEDAEGERGAAERGRASTADALADIDDMLVGLDPSMRLSGIQQQPAVAAQEPPPLPLGRGQGRGGLADDISNEKSDTMFDKYDLNRCGVVPQTSLLLQSKTEHLPGQSTDCRRLM